MTTDSTTSLLEHFPGTRKYSEVDVFSDQPYLGNPLALVHDAQGLDEAQMQRFAKWPDLAETTFIIARSHP